MIAPISFDSADVAVDRVEFRDRGPITCVRPLKQNTSVLEHIIWQEIAHAMGELYCGGRSAVHRCGLQNEASRRFVCIHEAVGRKIERTQAVIGAVCKL